MKSFRNSATEKVKIINYLTRHYGAKVCGFSKEHHIFGLPNFRSLFHRHYFSRIFLNYDFIDLLSI